MTRMQFYHHSRNPLYRSPTGSQPCGAKVTLRLRLEGGLPEAVHLHVWFDKESFYPMRPLTTDPALYEAVFNLPESPCLLWYDFQVWQGGQFYWYGNAEDGLGGEGAFVWHEVRSFQITVYDPAYETPAWTRGAVFYQIFPDRFARGGNMPSAPEGRMVHESWDDLPGLMMDPATGDSVPYDFFGGTLTGIVEKLPYLASLGVTGIYLNPIFHAATNHRFDTTDWMTIDPLLGDEQDFCSLCAAAKALGIRIVLDGVFNHSGNVNPFFQSARATPDSPYRNWYLFEHWPDMYKCWWGFETLPNLNKHQPEVIDYFLTGESAVVRKWPRLGADGWRIDVADELPMEYLALMRRSVKAVAPEGILIGEVWEDASHKVSYDQMRSYCLGDTFDGVMNYPLREAAIGFLTGGLDAAGFKRRMDSLYENYPPPFTEALLNVLGSHDRPRILNVLAGVEGENLSHQDRARLALTEKQRALGVKRLKMLLALIVAMPGMPCVYYGDEAGMEGAADPFNRATFPWGREDKTLTDAFREGLRRKRTVPALSGGALSIDAPTPDILVIKRETPGQTAYTALNRGDHIHTIHIDGQTIALGAYGSVGWEA